MFGRGGGGTRCSRIARSFSPGGREEGEKEVEGVEIRAQREKRANGEATPPSSGRT